MHTHTYMHTHTHTHTHTYTHTWLAATAALSPVVPLIRPSTTPTRPVVDARVDAVEASSVEIEEVVEMLLASSALTCVVLVCGKEEKQED
jgi:hypothetical protein